MTEGRLRFFDKLRMSGDGRAAMTVLLLNFNIASPPVLQSFVEVLEEQVAVGWGYVYIPTFLPDDLHGAVA